MNRTPKYIVFQTRVLIDDKLFKENNQFEIKDTRVVEEESICGVCLKDVTYYLICCDGTDYEVRENYVALSDVEIPKQSQDFDVARRDQHRNAGIDDYDTIRTNNDPARIWNIVNKKQGIDGFRH